VRDGAGNAIAPGTVLAQYVFEPYGGVALSETLVDNLATELTNTLGHQGLHFVRLDDTSPAANTLTPTARGLYYNRNRFYSPDLGRFITRDPNATALPIITAIVFNAEATSILLTGFDGKTLYDDGMNLYGYLNSNPVNRRDPLGLFDDFDDVMMDLYAEAGAAAFAVLDKVGAAFDMFTFTLDIASSFVPGVDTIRATYDYINGDGSLKGIAFGLAMEFTGPFGDSGRAFFKIAKKVGKATSRYKKVAKAAARAFDDAWRLVQRNWKGGKGLTRYHWEKHAKKFDLSLEEYTDDAVNFFRRNRGAAREFPIDGGTGIGLRIDGKPGGIFTTDGKIVTFWYD